MTEFEKLFEPIKVGTMYLKNRIVMPPFCMKLANRDGLVTERLVNFLAERAKGGAGLIVAEMSYIDDKASKTCYGQLGVYDDSLIPGLMSISKAIKLYDAKAAIQPAHVGSHKFYKGPAVAPSTTSWRIFGGPIELISRELTLPEIEEIIEAFGNAARITKEAGFDAIEIHGAHQYLITNFLSPRFNKRTDHYGGSFENRLRFAIEIAERIKEKIGKSFPLIFKLSVEEETGGITIEEGVKTAKKLEDVGVDAIVASSGCHDNPHEIPRNFLPLGCHVYLAEEVKKVVDIPVVAIGAINDPKLAEKILREGKADLIALGRQLVADPYWPKKIMEGRLEDIRQDIRCDQACRGTIVKCSINASVGKEERYRIKPALKPKEVLVVGGGPAGMEASRILKLRGHRVILYEKDNKLGGQLRLADRAPNKGEFGNLTKYLITQIKKLGVRVEFRNVTRSLVEEAKADAVIVATGARPRPLNIPGMEKDNVTSFYAILSGKAEVGEKVVLSGRKNFNIFDAAEMLAEKGKTITVVTSDENFYHFVGAWEPYFSQRLSKAGVKILINSKVAEITDQGVTIVDKDRNRNTIDADTIAFACVFPRCDRCVGICPKPGKTLFEKLKGIVPELYMIGDCVEPRSIMNAIHEAAHVAREI